MAELKFIVTMDSSQFNAGAQKVMADVKQITNSVDKEGKKIERTFGDMGKTIGGSLTKYIGMIGGAAMFKSLIDNIVKVRSEFEKAGVAIETMLGSKQEADALMSEVKQIAAASPLEFSDITRATQQMLSFNIEAEKVPGFIRAIGDVSMGEKDRFNSLALAFSQMSATGKLMGQDLLQMINAGFNPLAEISRTTGKSIGQLKDEMSQGAISAEMVQKAFIDATSAGGKFFGMSENASKTIAGQFSMLQDAVDAAMNEVGTQTQGIISGSISAVTFLVKNYETLIKIIAALAANYGVYRAAVALTTATEAAHSAGQVVATVRTLLLEKAQRALNAAMAVNPYVAAAVALSSLISVITLVATGESDMEKAANEANKAIEDQKKLLDERRTKITNLINTIKAESSTEYQRVEAFEELKTLAPELTKEYDRMAIANLDLAEAQAKANEEIDDAEFENIKNQYYETVAALEEYQRQLKEIENNRGLYGQGAEAVIDATRKQIEQLKGELKTLRPEYERIVELRKQAAEEAKPVKVRIEEAQENEAVRKRILDFFDEAMQRAKDLESTQGGMRFDGALASLDEVIDKMTKDVDDLRQKFEREPLNTHLQLEYNEKLKILNEIVDWRNTLESGGYTVIPMELRLHFAGVQSAWSRLRGVVDGLKNRLLNSEDDKPYQQALNEARTAYLQAQKRLNQARNKSKGEFVQAKKDFEEAEKKYKELGGETSTKVKTPKTPKKSGKSAADIAEEQAKQRAAALQEERRLIEEQAALERTAEDAVAAARIAAIKDNGRRERAEQDEEHRKRLRDIHLQADEYAKEQYENNKRAWELTHKKGVYEDTAEGKAGWEALTLTDEQRRIIEAQVLEEEANYERILAQRRQAESTALREYLKEYGSAQKQRLAIAQEYDEKIRQAQSTGERLALQAEKDKALDEYDFAKFREGINWEAVFGDLDRVSLEHLRSLKDQLQKTLQDASLSATDYKTIVEQISRIESTMVEKQNEWKNVFGLVIPELEQRKQLEQEAADAQARATELAKQQAQALADVNAARVAIQGKALSAGVSIDASEIRLENVDSILGQFDETSDTYLQLKAMFDSLAGAERELATTTDKLADAEVDATLKADKAASTLTSAITAIKEIGDKVNANIQSTVDLIETLGISDTAFGKGMGDFADAAQAANSALSNLTQGNVIGAANDVLKSIGSLGKALGNWGIGGFGESDKSLERDIERLTNSNNALRKAVEDLTDEMADSPIADATEIYQRMVSNIELSVKQSKELLQRTGAAYNNGFLGIGGSGSSNSKINAGMSSAEWQRISAIVGRAVTSASQFWTLSSKEMSDVAKLAPEVYAHINQLASEGYKDASQFMEEYIGLWRQLEEAQAAYYERMTSTSLDSIVSDFTSALADMDSSAADFANNFENYLKNAIIAALVSEKYKPMIKTWYENFAKAAESNGIDQAEMERLREEWKNITDEGLKDREELRQMFGWGSTGEGSGAYSAIASFTQEQGDELNGRLTALQIGQAYQNEQLAQAVMTLQSMAVISTSSNTALTEMRNIMLIANGHLEDIAKYTKLTSQHSELLNEIATKIKTL